MTACKHGPSVAIHAATACTELLMKQFLLLHDSGKACRLIAGAEISCMAFWQVDSIDTKLAEPCTGQASSDISHVCQACRESHADSTVDTLCLICKCVAAPVSQNVWQIPHNILIELDGMEQEI